MLTIDKLSTFATGILAGAFVFSTVGLRPAVAALNVREHLRAADADSAALPSNAHTDAVLHSVLCWSALDVRNTVSVEFAPCRNSVIHRYAPNHIGSECAVKQSLLDLVARGAPVDWSK